MTATASMEERENIPHHLLSFLESSETEFNCNKFVQEANKVLVDMEERKVQNAIIVGGTNYYTESLIFSKNRTENDTDSNTKVELTEDQ
jgi:tRNA dimethylallyltransferase